MYSIRTLVLGTLLTAVYSLLATWCPARQWGILLLLLMLSGGLLVFVVNPLFARTKRLAPFHSSELVLLACMMLISAALSGTGVATRVVQGIATLHNPIWKRRAYCEKKDCYFCNAQGEQGASKDCSQCIWCIGRTWNATVEPYLPDRLFVSQPGSRRHAQALQRELDGYAQLELQQNQAVEERRKTEVKLQKLFEQYLNQEAACYGCSVEDIARPRQRRDELQRELIQVTRQLNELRTDPNTARSRTLAEAVALNKRLSELYTRQRCREDDIAKLDEQLKELRKNARAEELSKLAAIKQEIQAVQAHITALSNTEKEYGARIEKKHGEVLQAKVAGDMNKAPIQEVLKEYNEGKGQLEAGLSDLEALFNAVPWHVWGLPLAVWGALACVTFLIFHQLSILLHWHWKSLERPDAFPLMDILETLRLHKPEDGQQPSETDNGVGDAAETPPARLGFLEKHRGGIIALAAGGLVVLCFMVEPVSFRLPFLEETRLFPFTLSLTAFAVAMLLPVRLTAPCLVVQAIVMALVAALSLCQPGGDWQSAVHGLEIRLFSGNGLFIGCALGMTLFLGNQANFTLFSCLHPYDIPNAGRKERHDLVRASAFAMLGLLALCGMLMALLDVELEVAYAYCTLLVLLTIFSAHLACETGLPYLGQPVALQSMLYSFPASFVPTSLFLSLFALQFRCVPLFAHGVHLRNCFRLKRGMYQTGAVLAVAVSASCSVMVYLMLAYSGRLPVEYQETAGTVAGLFDGFAMYSSEMSVLMLALGTLMGCIAMACFRGGASGMALCLVAPLFPSLFPLWFSLLGGCIASALSARFLSVELNRLVRLACFAVAVASVLFGL